MNFLTKKTKIFIKTISGVVIIFKGNSIFILNEDFEPVLLFFPLIDPKFW